MQNFVNASAACCCKHMQNFVTASALILCEKEKVWEIWKALSVTRSLGRALWSYRRLSKSAKKRLLTSSCMSLRPSVCLCPHPTTGPIFHEIWHLNFIETVSRKFKFCQSNQEWIQTHIFDYISLIYSENKKCFRQKHFKKNLKKPHFVFSNPPFFFENRAFYEVMWKNMVERGGPQMKIWLTHVACCIPKATNTHSDYVKKLLFFFSLQQSLQEGASVWRHT